jgi:hypothetical protein
VSSRWPGSRDEWIRLSASRWIVLDRQQTTLYSSSVRTDFRETSPTLSGTCFGTDDLILARSVYESVFADIDPEWPNDPTGPLAAYWRAVDSHSAAYLIHLARVLWQLSNKNVTAKSFPILRNKVQMLLRPPSSTSYEETLIELEVASSLSERISPISFEPLVPAGLSNAPSKPTSPDYVFVFQIPMLPSRLLSGTGKYCATGM